jgi:hypothetical protein
MTGTGDSEKAGRLEWAGLSIDHWIDITIFGKVALELNR